MTTRRSLLAVTALSLMLVAGACSAEENQAPAEQPAAAEQPATPSGSTVSLGDEKTGATVDLPAGWTEVPLDPDKLEQALKQMDWGDPAHAATARKQATAVARRGQALVEQGALRYAVAPASAGTSPDGSVTNASVMRLSVRAETVDQLAGEVHSALGQNQGIKDLQVEAVKLPAGDAARATYQLEGLDITYVALLGDGEALVLVMGTDQPDTYQPVFDQIAQTLRPAG